MSDEIHAQHEFVPKLLRRKLEAADKGREQFIEDIRQAMVPYLLARRNVLIARGAGYRKIVSVAETARLPWTHWDEFNRWGNWWYHQPERDVIRECPMWSLLFTNKTIPYGRELDMLHDEARIGIAWVKRFREVKRNLSKTATRRVYVSTDLLSSIVHYASYVKGDRVKEA